MRSVKEVTVADGQITFCMIPYKTLRFDITLEEFVAAHEELIERRDGMIHFKATPTSDALLQLIYNIGHTFDARFKLKKNADPALHDFHEWWDNARQSHDARAVFDAYQWLSKDIQQLWKDAYKNTRQKELEAAPEIQVEDSEAEENPLEQSA